MLVYKSNNHWVFFRSPENIPKTIAIIAIIGRPARAMRRRGTGTSAGAGTWCKTALSMEMSIGKMPIHTLHRFIRVC